MPFVSAASSVQLALPAAGNPPGRARGRLIERVVFGRCQRWPVVVVLGLIAPEPVFAGLEAADYRMPGRRGMSGRVLRRRGVAAADVPALGAPAQMQPPSTGGVALHTAGPARRNRRVDPRHLFV